MGDFQERKRHKNINTYFRWLPGWGGALDQVARGQTLMRRVGNPRFSCGYPAGRIGDRGDRGIVYVPNVYAPFWPLTLLGRSRLLLSLPPWFVLLEVVSPELVPDALSLSLKHILLYLIGCYVVLILCELLFLAMRKGPARGKTNQVEKGGKTQKKRFENGHGNLGAR